MASITERGRVPLGKAGQMRLALKQAGNGAGRQPGAFDHVQSPLEKRRLRALYLQSVYESILDSSRRTPEPGDQAWYLVGPSYIPIRFDRAAVEASIKEKGADKDPMLIAEALRRIPGTAVENCGGCRKGLPVIMSLRAREHGGKERRCIVLCPWCGRERLIKSILFR